MRRSITARRGRGVLAGLAGVAAALLLTAAPAAAAWTTPSVIVSDPNNDSWMFDNENVLIAGGRINYVYADDDGPIFMRTNLDGSDYGFNEHLLEETGDWGEAQGMAANTTTIYALYRDDAGPSTLKFRATSISSGGQVWPLTVQIASIPGRGWMGSGSIAVSGNIVLVAWTDGRNGHVNLRRSTDGGVTFGATVRLATTKAIYYADAIYDGQVHLAASGSSFIATWNAAESGIRPKKLVLRRSIDAGVSFLPTQTLDASVQAFDGPSISMAGTQVLISHAIKAGNVRVLHSTNGGKTFASTDVSGTRHTQDRTDISVDPANRLAVRVVWSHGDAVFLRRSSNGGASWSATEDTKIRFEEGGDLSPNVVVSGGNTVVAWNAQACPNPCDVPSNVIGARAG